MIWDQRGARLFASGTCSAYQLHTPYTAIVPAVAKLAAGPPLNGEATLVVDQTGVGRPVVEMLMRAPVPARIVPVTITAGSAITRAEDGSFHVPKKVLVTSLQIRSPVPPLAGGPVAARRRRVAA